MRVSCQVPYCMYLTCTVSELYPVLQTVQAERFPKLGLLVLLVLRENIVAEQLLLCATCSYQFILATVEFHVCGNAPMQSPINANQEGSPQRGCYWYVVAPLTGGRLISQIVVIPVILQAPRSYWIFSLSWIYYAFMCEWERSKVHVQTRYDVHTCIP